MNKYYPESMVSAMQAMSEVESIGNTARRINDEYQSQISKALRPVMNQAAFMQIDIKPMSFDLSAIKIQTQMNTSIAQQMKELSEELQRPIFEAFKEMSITNDILSQFNMRGLVYTASTVKVDSTVTDEDEKIILDYSKSVIESSYLSSALDVVGVLTWTYTACQFMNDPTLIDLFMNILSYIHSNRKLLEERRDED